MLSNLKLIFFLIMLAGAGGGFMYVKNLKAENEILRLNNSKLNDAVDEQQGLIEQMQKDIETKNVIMDQLRESEARAKESARLTEEKFNKVNASGERRDIGNLAISKPKSIERIERKREQQRARCWEIAQNSPLTEEEINATKKSEINAECPVDANPNYHPY